MFRTESVAGSLLVRLCRVFLEDGGGSRDTDSGFGAEHVFVSRDSPTPGACLGCVCQASVGDCRKCARVGGCMGEQWVSEPGRMTTVECRTSVDQDSGILPEISKTIE